MYVKKTVLKKCDDIVQIIKSKNDDRKIADKAIFTETELDYCAQRIRCLGARFMIKECVFDYLESEMGHVEKNYHEIEIINNEFKKPVIRLFNGISECVRKLNIREILISISHSRKWITGMVLFCY